ncbi:hypothetical protein F4677DRAFT_264880 [Hypoxylon crocopeplum]|nr:hypothetical protein F4677DRAFT_264880 [Hypoxylon crocopeplum]
MASKTAEQRAAFGDRLSELTTVFTPPCSVTWLLTTTKVPSQYPAFPTTGPASCDPPLWTDYLSQKGFAYYSPAICPSGFSAGCTAGPRRSGEGFPAITADETAVYCVPSGFTCTSDTTDFRGGVWGFLRTSSANGASVTVGPAIQIRWREDDLSKLATDPLTPGLVATRASTSLSPLLVIATPAAPPQVSTTSPTTRTTTTPDVATPTSRTAQVSSSSTSASSASGDGDGGDREHPTDVSPSKTLGVSTTSPLPLIDQPSSPTTVQLGATTTTNSGGTATPSETGGNASPSVASSTSMAAMALSGILIFMILGFLALSTIRRYRRYRAGELRTFLPPSIGTWAKRVLWRSRYRPPSHRTISNLPHKHVDAELGTDGPTPELGEGNPLGTKENPAELAGNSVRNSLMSQVSRIFSVRLKKETGSV